VSFPSLLLKLDITPLIGRCRKCDDNFQIIDYNFSCPQCGIKEIDIVSGRDMNIVELEVD
jgi:hydrogenase nickel incorporation protein HypA/HybF